MFLNSIQNRFGAELFRSVCSWYQHIRWILVRYTLDRWLSDGDDDGMLPACYLTIDRSTSHCSDSKTRLVSTNILVFLFFVYFKLANLYLCVLLQYLLKTMKLRLSLRAERNIATPRTHQFRWVIIVVHLKIDAHGGNIKRR